MNLKKTNHSKNKFMLELSRWNWSLFFVILCMSFAGGLSNKNCARISDSLILGLIGGILFGLPMAILTKEPKEPKENTPDV